MKNYTSGRPPFIKLRGGKPKNIPNPSKKKKEKHETNEWKLGCRNIS